MHDVLETAYIQSPDQFDKGNVQEIKEILIRLSCKYCERYATDVLILFDLMREKIENDFVIDIGFRQFGVDFSINKTEKYRYIARVEKKGTTLILSGELGNV